MTQEKAREYFSAYREGTLEPGLRASLEHALQADATLQSEYDAFAGTMDALLALKAEKIAAPSYLNDRITARLEPARAPKEPFWAAWLRPATGTGVPRLAWAGVAAVVLLAAVVGLQGLHVEGASQGGVVSTASEGVSWRYESGQLFADFVSGADQTVTTTPEGGSPESIPVLSGQKLQLTLDNPASVAKRFEVKFGSGPSTTIVLPGSRTTARKAGEGTIGALATALADTYHVAVVLKTDSIGDTVRWTFDKTDAKAAAQQAIEGKANATLVKNDVIQID